MNHIKTHPLIRRVTVEVHVDRHCDTFLPSEALRSLKEDELVTLMCATPLEIQRILEAHDYEVKVVGLKNS